MPALWGKKALSFGLAAICFSSVFWSELPQKLFSFSTAALFPVQSLSIWYRKVRQENTAESPKKVSAQSEVSSAETVAKETTSVAYLPEGNRGGRIYEEQLTFQSGGRVCAIGKGLMKNDTALSNTEAVKLASLLPDFQVDLESASPQVLVYHTHATESFDLYDCGYFEKEASARTTDKAKNMVAVGDALCARLKAAGIAFVHDTNLYDSPSYNGSYQRSAARVTAYLKQYPSIRVVIDLHRDAVYAEDGGWRKFTVQIKGRKAAQVMIISGCENGRLHNPNWQKNLRFAALLENQLETDYPGLTRPLYFCYRNYNQHLSEGSILIEVGTHGNSLPEALYSGELLGNALAKALQRLKK